VKPVPQNEADPGCQNGPFMRRQRDFALRTRWRIACSTPLVAEAIAPEDDHGEICALLTATSVSMSGDFFPSGVVFAVVAMNWALGLCLFVRTATEESLVLRISGAPPKGDPVPRGGGGSACHRARASSTVNPKEQRERIAPVIELFKEASPTTSGARGSRGDARKQRAG
jgi:hypothetical protein